MKKAVQILAAVLFFGAIGICGAAARVDAPLAADDLELIKEACAGIGTMQCDFEQKRHLAMLSDTPVAKGKMWFDGKRVRWEYTSPTPYLFIMDGTNVLLQGKERRVVEIKTDRLFSKISKLAEGNNIILGQGLDNIQDFDASLTKRGGELVVELVPTRRDFQMFFRMVRLYFGADYRVHKIELLEKGSDSTEISLLKQKYNQKIEDDIFRIQ